MGLITVFASFTFFIVMFSILKKFVKLHIQVRNQIPFRFFLDIIFNQRGYKKGEVLGRYQQTHYYCHLYCR